MEADHITPWYEGGQTTSENRERETAYYFTVCSSDAIYNTLVR
jgi:hypothetical protein